MALEKSNGGMDPEALAAMMQQMGGKGKIQAQANIRYRFSDPKIRPGAEKRSIEYAARDPLQDVMTKKGKPTEKLDTREWLAALRDTSSYNPEFLPFHEVMGHPKWPTSDKITAVRMLCDYGISPNLIHGTSTVTPLHRAIENREKECAATLISYGADINSRDYRGNTGVMSAIRSGQLDLIVPMIRRGGRSDKNSNGHDAVDLAIERFKQTQDEHMLFNTLRLIKKTGLTEKNGAASWISEEQREYLLNTYESDEERRLRKGLRTKLLEEIDALDKAKITPLNPERLHTNPKFELEPEVYKSSKRAGLLSWLFSHDQDMRQANAEFDAVASSLRERLTAFNLQRIVAKKNAEISDFYTVLKEGNKVNLENARLEPHSDTLFLHAVRNNNAQLLEMAINQGFNMNARDNKGNSALHLMALQLDVSNKSIAARDSFIERVSNIIGLPSAEGRTALNGHGYYADWYLTDNQGRTFLDVLSETHPEWVSHIANTLGLPNDKISPNPDLLLLTYSEPPTLKPSDLPVISSLPSTATALDKTTQSVMLQELLHKMYTRLDQNVPADEAQQFNEVLQTSLDNVSTEVKIESLFSMSAHVDNSENQVHPKAVSALLAHIVHQIEHGNGDEKNQIFNSFDTVLKNYEETGGDLRFLYHNMTMLGVLTSQPEYSRLGSRLENALSNMAQQKYGSMDSYATENDQKPKL